MNTYYVLPSSTDPSNPPASDVTRAQDLIASLIVGDPSGLVTAYPSVVVMSSATTAQVIPDDTGQATLAEVQSAQTTATNAESTKATNIANALSAVKSSVAQLSPAQTQAQADLTTLSTSTDALAPIVARLVQGSLAVADAVANLLVALEIIE